MSWMNKHRFSIHIPILILSIVILLTIVNSNQIVSYFYSNLGWLYITSALNNSSTTHHAKLAEHYFSSALRSSVKGSRIRIGAGLSAALLGKEQVAQAFWSEQLVPPTGLLSMGQAMRMQHRDSLALLLLRTMPEKDKSITQLGSHIVGELCQRNYASLTDLQLGNTSYCERYFANNNHNLLLNGNFDEGKILGWRGLFYFAPIQDGIFSFDSSEGHPLPSLLLQGFQQSQRYAIYQSITLKPGTQLQFTGWFKVDLVEPSSAKILYIEWKQLEVTNGNYAHLLTDSHDWNFFERTFVVPDNYAGVIRFYPALLDGKGLIWIDNLHLKVMSS